MKQHYLNSTTILKFAWIFLLGIASCIPMTAQVSRMQPSGSGTQEDPYLIESLAHLSWLTQTNAAWTSYFVQTADIDASQTQYWDDSDDNGDGDPYNDPNDGTSDGNNEGFLPIGPWPDYFYGDYDGGGYTVDGLYIHRPSDNEVGFFATFRNTESRSLRNLGVTNCDITGHYPVGALVGYATGDIDQCYSSGSVQGTSQTGGLAGRAYYGEISNSYSTVSVSGQYSAGGFIGMIDYLDITHCYSNGSVVFTNYGGGFVGDVMEFIFSETASYWDTQTSGQTNSWVGTGKTTAEMMTQSTFTGWDFDSVWAIDPSINDGYPYLQWQDSETEVPMLSSPVTDTAFKDPIPIDFSLPESAQAGSIQLTFTEAGGQTVSLTLADQGPGQTTFDLVPSDLTGAEQVVTATSTSLADGTYTVTLAYQDERGHPAATSTAATGVIVDTEAPAVSYISLRSNNHYPEYAKVGDSIQLDVIAVGPLADAVLTINSAPVEWEQVGDTIRAAAVVTDLWAEEGVGFTVSIEDAAGNTTQAAATTDGSEVRIDRTAPIPRLEDVPEGTVNGPFTVRLLFDEPVYQLSPSPVIVSPDAQNNPRASLGSPVAITEGQEYSIEVTPLVEGEFQLYFDMHGMARDLAGNDSQPLAFYTVDFDGTTEPPLLNAPLSNTYSQDTILIDFDLSEDASPGTVALFFTDEGGGVVEVFLEATSAGNHQFELHTQELNDPTVGSTSAVEALPEGVYTIGLQYQDALGNTVATDSVQNFVLDRTAPVLNVSLSSSNSAEGFARVGDEVYLDISSDEVLTAITVSINGEAAFVDHLDGLQSRAVLPITFEVEEGVVTFEIDVIDPARNETRTTVTTDGSSVVVDLTAPVVDCREIEVFLNEQGFAAIGSEDISETITDNFSLGEVLLDTSEFDCTDLGVRLVTLTARDEAGNTTDCTTAVSVRDELSPVVQTQDRILELNLDGSVQLSVNDIDNGSFDNCGITSRTLDRNLFGLSDLGMRTVTLTVTDSSGNSASATAQVTITFPDTDSDGVHDQVDQCPGTPVGSEVDANGCPLPVVLTGDDFTVEVTEYPCGEEGVGTLLLSASNPTLEYDIRINGQTALSLNADTGLSREWTGLPSGNHTVCFSAPEQDFCFEIELAQLPGLEVVSNRIGETRVVLELSGSDTYQLTHNGQTRTVFESTAFVDLEPGINVISVETEQACQGSFNEEFVLTETAAAYPNPATTSVNLVMPGSASEAVIDITNTQGASLFSKRLSIPANRVVTIPVDGLPRGVLFVFIRSGGDTRELRVVKQ